MSELRGRKCVPCEGGMAALDAGAAAALHAKLDPRWVIAADNASLRREWKFRDFYRTMSFVGAVAHIANTEDHHPDVELGYNYCRITWTTHAIGGLSENDFICAAKLDELP